jgi:DNA invertase Pin-like site-specific DNA recombinase
MRYFYARVSTEKQNLARQLKTAKSFYSTYDEIFADKQSGKDFNRDEYQRMKSILKKGDELVVSNLDRLGRNKDEIKDELKWFKDNGVVARILDVPTTLIDFQGQEWIADMVNNILIEVMGAIAEQERDKIIERTNEGIQAMPVVDGKRVSTKTGNPMGRPPASFKVSESEFKKIYKKQKEGLISVAEAISKLDISRSTWYNLAKEYVI